jgi:hypothetical protein
MPHFPIDIFQDQSRLIIDRLFSQCLANTLDRIEGSGHLVFFFQGSKTSLGWVEFAGFLITTGWEYSGRVSTEITELP